MARKDISDAQVVKACKQCHDGDRRFVTEILMEWTSECEKVCYAAMERADDRGLIECGVSLRTSWPTKKGLELLKESEEVQ